MPPPDRRQPLKFETGDVKQHPKPHRQPSGEPLQPHCENPCITRGLRYSRIAAASRSPLLDLSHYCTLGARLNRAIWAWPSVASPEVQPGAGPRSGGWQAEGTARDLAAVVALTNDRRAHDQTLEAPWRWT